MSNARPGRFQGKNENMGKNDSGGQPASQFAKKKGKDKKSAKKKGGNPFADAAKVGK